MANSMIIPSGLARKSRRQTHTHRETIDIYSLCASVRSDCGRGPGRHRKCGERESGAHPLLCREHKDKVAQLQPAEDYWDRDVWTGTVTSPGMLPFLAKGSY